MKTIEYFLQGKKIDDRLNEDGLFSDILSPSYLNQNIPEPETAAYFAFENPPSYLYKMCNNQLPFGCHAFLKFEYETFWKQYIEKD